MPILNPKSDKSCFICGKLISYLRIYCSKQCKSKSQELKINFVCNGCRKVFKRWPCMKRKTNYCSVDCYRNSTRRDEKRLCKICNKEFFATQAQIKCGFGIFCSRKCQHKTYPKQVKKVCPQCSKKYYVPPSWATKRNYCSKKCQDDSMRDYVSCVCRCCKKEFQIPRSDLNRGRGTYCSRRCFVSYQGSSLLELKMEKALTLAKIEFDREVKFKRFHVDFLIQKYKTAVECDGEYWHLIPKILERDKRKDILLQSLGYKVIRFTGSELDKLNVDELSRILLKKFNS